MDEYKSIPQPSSAIIKFEKELRKLIQEDIKSAVELLVFNCTQSYRKNKDIDFTKEKKIAFDALYDRESTDEDSSDEKDFDYIDENPDIIKHEKEIFKPVKVFLKKRCVNICECDRCKTSKEGVE